MDITEKPKFSICAWCQKQHPEVDKAVRANQDKYNISHGICVRHYQEMMNRPLDLTKASTALPDLNQHPELVQFYSQGNFFPQQQLKERLQKLANIKGS